MDGNKRAGSPTTAEIIVLVALALLGAILVANFSMAWAYDTLLSQSTAGNSNNFTVGNDVGSQVAAQRFVLADSATVNEATFKFSHDSGSDSEGTFRNRIMAVAAGSDPDGFGPDFTDILGTSNATSVPAGIFAATDYTFVFPTPVELAAGDYFITLEYVSGATPDVNLKGSNTTQMTGRCSRYNATGTYQADCGLNDIYLILLGTVSQPTVEITFPADNSTSTADLFYLSGTFDFVDTDLGLPLSRGWVEVNYGTSSGNYSFQDESDTTKSFSAGPAASGSWNVTRSQTFPASSIVYAQATLHLERWYFSSSTLTSTTLQIATSSEISYGIGTIGAPFEALFSATTTLSNLTGDCSPDFLINSLCGLFRTLFIPSSSSLTIVNTIKDKLSTKPPFGYVSSFIAATDNFSDSATSTADFSAADGLASVFDAPKTMVAWLVWFIWGFWIFRKFRHFKF